MPIGHCEGSHTDVDGAEFSSLSRGEKHDFVA